MRFVEFGALAFLFGLAVLGLLLAVPGLVGWTFVHDKLRRERKEDGAP